MHVLGIVGSAKKRGRTALHVMEALKAAECSSDILFLSDYNLRPCTDCDACRKGECIIQDDMHKIYPLLEKADGIIAGSPVYFGSLSAQLKIVFDRSIYLRRQGFRLRNKVGGAIAVGRSFCGGQEHTIQSIHAWMLIHDMIVVGDGIPHSHFGGTGQDVENDKYGLETSRNLGRRVAEALRLIGKNKPVGGAQYESAK